MTLKFVDLFCGTGGIRLGFEQAARDLGIATECVRGCEINPEAAAAYEDNFGEDPTGDVTRLDLGDTHVDAILAGFPCQPFSTAGSRRGFEDTRGTLFFDVLRLAERHRPGLVFLENVRGLVSHDGGRTLRVIRESLESLGYHVDARLINATTCGVPQNRIRIYITATLKPFSPAVPGDRLGNQTTLKGENPCRLASVLEDDPDPKYDCSERFTGLVRKALGGSLDGVVGKRFRDKRGGEGNIHSWQLSLKGECSPAEVAFMDAFLSNKHLKSSRASVPGDGNIHESLARESVEGFAGLHGEELDSVLASLAAKGHLALKNGRYSICGGCLTFELFKVLDPDSVALTLTASDCFRQGVYHNSRLRRLTPRECARLMGYPDSYRLPESDKVSYRLMGNAVCVPVIREVLREALPQAFLDTV